MVVELGKVFDGIEISFLRQVFRILRFSGQPEGTPVDQIEMRQQMLLDLLAVRILGNFLFYLTEYIHSGEAVVANVEWGMRAKNIPLRVISIPLFKEMKE